MFGSNHTKFTLLSYYESSQWFLLNIHSPSHTMTKYSDFQSTFCFQFVIQPVMRHSFTPFFQYHACIYTPTYSSNKPIPKRYIDSAPNSNPIALKVLIERKVSSKVYYNLKEWKDFSMQCCINNILDSNFPWSFHKHRSHFSSPNNSTLKNTTQKTFKCIIPTMKKTTRPSLKLPRGYCQFHMYLYTKTFR
jgi:hypothetical protein